MTRLSLVPPTPEPSIGERVMLGAEVGRMIRAGLVTLDPKLTPNVSNEARLWACLTVMTWHTNRLDRRRPGWLPIAQACGWLP